MTNTSRNRGIGIVTARQPRDQRVNYIFMMEKEGKSQAALGVVLRTIGLGICEKRQSESYFLDFKGPERAYDEDSAIEALQRGFHT